MGTADPGGELYLGIDGGATHCRARIRDAGNRLLGEASAGPANSRLGIASAMREVAAAARIAAAAAGLGESDLARLHAGLGLAGVTGEREAALVLAEPSPFASVAVDSDAYAAWLGAFGGKDGAILIVGTGSCGLAVVDGRRINVGGWGDVVSDDGSGNAIGRALIRRALWSLEGLAPPSGLADAALARFERDPEKIVAWGATATKTDFARFAPLVFEHAAKCDPLALQLIEEAARHLARMAGRLLDSGAPSVALIGGLAEAMAPWLVPPLRERIVAPLADAADGAILMARQARAARSSGKP
jgi:glucosamine kinase